MLKRLFGLVLIVVSLGLVACGSKPQVPPLPPEKEMRYEVYPILPTKHEMTAAEVHGLGLRVKKLGRPTLAFNHYRELGRDRKGGWRDEVLKPGTMVAVDASGRPWYKLDCANRLYVPTAGTDKSGWYPFGAPGSGGDGPGGSGGSSGSGNGGRSGWPWWWLLIPVAGLLGALLWRLMKRRRDEINQDTEKQVDELIGKTGYDEPRLANLLDDVHARIGGLERGVEDLRSSVAGVREVVTGLEDRVTTRLEPVVRSAAEGGARERAKAAVASQIVECAAKGNTVMVNALNRTMAALDS